MIQRRTLLAAVPLALAGCRNREEAYFGKTDPPRTQRLVYLLGAEPGTLDPTLSNDIWEAPVIHAMFEGLTSFDGRTGEPVAALATHYEVTSDKLEYIFRLRGHAKPRGIPLRAFGRPQTPACWSDGKPITAHDFVYSWRRAADPATAATNSYLFPYIANGEAIVAGRQHPEELAVRALDDFTLHLQLTTPFPLLLRLLAHRFFFAIPRQAIEQARRRGNEGLWTEPENIVTSGAFRLRERSPHEKILLTRNARYDAETVSLEEILFLPVIDGSTSANLYRAGEAAFSMPMVPQVLAGLRRKRDVRTYRSCGAQFPAMNTRKPPFDDVRVRYAFNMAIDKRAIANFLGGGRTPLNGVVPPMQGYEPPASLPIAIGGTVFDVLSFNPEAARALLAKAGHGNNLKVEYLFPLGLAEFSLVAEILQQQWRNNLGIEVRLVRQENQTCYQTVFSVGYNGIAGWGETGGLEDPTWFLDIFNSPTVSGTGWSDPRYNDLLIAAKTTIDAPERMRRLAECERFLLRAMPCLPLYSDAWDYLCKPFVKGLAGNPFYGRMFNDAWIDTNWRPS